MAWLKKMFNQGEDDYAGVADSGDGQDTSLERGEEDDGQLALDVFQDKDNIYIKSTIAGVKPEDLDITLAPDSVTIQGERRHEEEVKDEDYFYQECYWGVFSRTLPLPMEIDVDGANAEIKDGILTLTLPKASKSRIKKVKVRGEG